MPATFTTPSLRVLIVDDNRDGADALGLVLEALGNEVHVTYGGIQALDVATAFRPDLMLIDLAMPEMNGCDLIQQFRKVPLFAKIMIVAMTGYSSEGHKNLALKAGGNSVIFKPVALSDIETALDAVLTEMRPHSPRQSDTFAVMQATERLSISKARKIRNDRQSKVLTEAESESAISDGICRFQNEYLGWTTDRIRSHFIKDMIVVRMSGVLTLAERQLGKSTTPGKGRDLIKQVRKQLLETARPMFESLVHEVIGVRVLSMHHDVSTVTGEEVIVLSLTQAPRFS